MIVYVQNRDYMLRILTGWLILAVVLFLCSCNRTETKYMAFDNVFYVSGFPQVYNLDEGENLDLELMGVQSLCVKDSILLISTLDDAGYWSFFRLPDHDYMGKFLAKGRGGNEVLASPRVAWQSFFSQGDDLYAAIYNFYSGDLLEMNVSKTLKDSSLSVCKVDLDLPKELFSFARIDSVSYFCREVNPAHTEQTRYILMNNDKYVPEYFEKLNGTAVDPGEDINILGCYYGYNQEKRIMAEACMDMNIINLYSVDGGPVNVTLCYGGKMSSVQAVQNAGPREKKAEYCNLVPYDDFFAALYYGETAYRIHEGKAASQQIQFFDWNGNPVAAVVLDKPANSFDIDFRRKSLYTLNYETEEIYRYDFSEPLAFLFRGQCRGVGANGVGVENIMR